MRQLLRIREDRVPRGWAVGQLGERERDSLGRGAREYAIRAEER